MELLLNAAQMKECDRYTIEQAGIPSAVLMERAALSVVEEMERAGFDLSDVLVICGSGNNGGDGFAAARLLAERMGYGAYEKPGWPEGFRDAGARPRGRVTLAFVGSETSMTAETARQRRICEACGLKPVSNFMDHAYTVIVDAMLGIGLSRNVEGRYAEIVRWINAQPAQVAAVDIPSGVSADSGRILGTAVRADLTVTFAYRKTGQILYPGADYCGKLVCRPIGVINPVYGKFRKCQPSKESAGAAISCADGGRTDSQLSGRPDGAVIPCEAVGRMDFQLPRHSAVTAFSCAHEDRGRGRSYPAGWPESAAFTCTDEDLARIAPRRARSNKGTYGKILLIAGSPGMSGAACLAARAAFRCGCGMVRVFTPECNRAVVQTVLPEAIVTVWKPQEAFEEKLKAALAWSDAAGIGPGLGQGEEAGRMLSLVLSQYEKPLVIDADGLNLLAGRRELPGKTKANVIVTPHIGEMARLNGMAKDEILAGLLACAENYARENGVICVLKDARTVVSDGKRLYLNTSGNHGMAAAGSGDVLTGVICSLLGQGMQPFDAAVLGVFLHGRAGDLAREKTGAYGMMAGDLADQLAEALKITERLHGGR